MVSFEEANKTVHKVEDQWHYPIMTAAGYVPVTKEAVGFVRSYTYKHPSHLVDTIRCCTGLNADYWESSIDGNRANGGYWCDLEKYVNK